MGRIEFWWQFSAEAKLIIELDGSQHYEDENIRKDARRTEFLEAYGLRIIRVANNEITENFDGVCDYIDAVVREACASLLSYSFAAPVQEERAAYCALTASRFLRFKHLHSENYAL